MIVSYLFSTSNHNIRAWYASLIRLYLIFFLHQTTTYLPFCGLAVHCILSFFYIKPQPFRVLRCCSYNCILSFFYIKPQLLLCSHTACLHCILSFFYIKPQPYSHSLQLAPYCILSFFYIKPQPQRLSQT